MDAITLLSLEALLMQKVQEFRAYRREFPALVIERSLVARSSSIEDIAETLAILASQPDGVVFLGKHYAWTQQDGLTISAIAPSQPKPAPPDKKRRWF